MSDRIYVAGHQGMVGSAIVRMLESDPNVELILRTHSELDLLDQSAVSVFFAEQKIDQVYLAAAKVGGIHANNQYPADFIYQNLMIQCNVVQAAYRAEVEKLLLLGSSCIYPKLAAQPIAEPALLSGVLEPTNEPYAVAKIAGIKLCESYQRQYGVDYRCVMPTNLYGPNDNFHPQNSHVIPGMMQRLYKAKLNGADKVEIWGSGKPMREFLHVDDMASACRYLMGLSAEQFYGAQDNNVSHINVGTGIDCTIRELAETLKEIVGFQGSLIFDTSKPDGAPRKLLDISILSKLGWRASIELKAGLQNTYDWYLQSQKSPSSRRGGRKK